MRLNLCLLALVCPFAFSAASAADAPAATESSRRTAYTIETMDRTLVPLVVETRETKVDATTTQRTDTILQPRANAGGLVETARATSLTRQVAPGTTETKTELIEIDRQGTARTSRQLTATVTKTSDGEQRKDVEYRRNSSGNLVASREVAAKTVKAADGKERTVRTEKELDPNGNFALRTEVEETVTPQGPNEKAVVTTVKGRIHTEGTFGVVREETATVKTEGATTRTETVIRTRRAGGFEVTGKTVATETKGTHGMVQREIIEEGEPRYSSYSPTPTEPLVAQRRIVEKEVRGADGTVRLQRDVYRRDVNGDWKPIAFSADVER